MGDKQLISILDRLKRSRTIVREQEEKGILLQQLERLVTSISPEEAETKPEDIKTKV